MRDYPRNPHVLLVVPLGQQGHAPVAGTDCRIGDFQTGTALARGLFSDRQPRAAESRHFQARRLHRAAGQHQPDFCGRPKRLAQRAEWQSWHVWHSLDIWEFSSGAQCARITNMGQFVARIDRVGRVVIPAPLRRRLGLVEGSQVILTCQQDALVMRTRRHGIAAAQKYFTKLSPAEELWSEDLIRDRRQEAQREHGF